MDTSMTTLNLYKICRVCLAESEEMHSIFSEIRSEDNVDEEPTYIYEMLMNISAVRILAEDRMPTMICSACLSMANSSYRFQQQCNRSQAVLEAYITQIDLSKEECVQVFKEIEAHGIKEIEIPDTLKAFHSVQVKEDPLQMDADDICSPENCFDADSSDTEENREDEGLVNDCADELKVEIKEEVILDAAPEDKPKEQSALKRTRGSKKKTDRKGSCESSVYKILKEHKENQTLSPPKRYCRPKAVLDNITEEQKSTIRRMLRYFFLNNEPPSVAKIINAVNEHEDLPNLKKTTMKKLLKALNFRYKGRGRNSIWKEKDEIVNWRRRYIQEFKNYTKEGRNIYYLGETCVTAGHTVSKAWTDMTVLSARDAFIRGLSTGMKEPSGKGQRLIILHVGSDNGFVENGLLILQSKKSGDCQEEMNSEVFEDWFKRILPNLDDGSVIVLDNASYHSRKVDKTDKIPTSASKKPQVQDWLRSNDVPFEKNMVKAELLVLVNQNMPVIQKYVVDELAKADDKIVLRLPPYHCELNPIELIWAQIKGEVARKSTTDKLENVKALFYEAMRNITAQSWKKAIQHVAFFQDKLREVDDLVEIQVEPRITNSQGDSSSESDIE